MKKFSNKSKLELEKELSDAKDCLLKLKSAERKLKTIEIKLQLAGQNPDLKKLQEIARELDSFHIQNSIFLSAPNE